MEDEGSFFGEVGMWDGWFRVISNLRGSWVGKGVKRENIFYNWKIYKKILKIKL